MRTHFASQHLARLALVTAAAFAVSGCEDLPIGDKTSPYYWSEVFLDMYADELVVGELEAGPEPLAEPRAVLLITGVTIDEPWFDPIVARLERDGFVPYVYVPPALLSGSLFQNAEDLADIVEQVRADSGQEKIDILAECTGGVIARHYVQSLGGDSHVSRLVTFVSPHNGIDKAPMAAAIAGWPALHDLTPGSEFLEAVNSAPLPESVALTSIYTCGDEYIQPWQGSIVPGATNIGLCGEFVGHFQTFYDPEIYLIMHAALTAPNGDEDPATLPEAPEATTNGPAGSGAASTNGDGVSTAGSPVGSPEPVFASSSVTIPASASAGGCSASGGRSSGAPLMALALGLLIAFARRTGARARLTSADNRANVRSR